MCSFTVEQKILTILMLACFAGAASVGPAVAQQMATPPDFSANLAGWVGLNGGGPFYEPVPGHVPPVVSDPRIHSPQTALASSRLFELPIFPIRT
jgi:hypothetical protein